jgi:antitoxin component YwqK of YwqJK toxin-antitoxin module
MQTKINQYDSKGQAHGYWKFYFGDGLVDSEGTYINGIREGLWVDYWSNGELAYKGWYKNGKMIGLWEYYDFYNMLIQIKFYANY